MQIILFYFDVLWQSKDPDYIPLDQFAFKFSSGSQILCLWALKPSTAGWVHGSGRSQSQEAGTRVFC